MELLDLPAASGDLPRVCVILQVASEGPLVDTYLYGRPLHGLVPTFLDPREVLDGALTAGQYDWAGVRDPTYVVQRSSLLRELLRRHGDDLSFCGVILTLGYLPSAFDKERSALIAAKLARQVGADAAVLTTFQSGNSHTDTVLTCRACERLGIRTVLLLAETNGGLTDHVPEARLHRECRQRGGARLRVAPHARDRRPAHLDGPAGRTTPVPCRRSLTWGRSARWAT